MPETSNDAYQTLLDRGEDETLRERVLRVLLAEPSTAKQVRKRLPERRSMNSVRPRINELLRMGLVFRTGKRKNPSGHDAYVYDAVRVRARKYLAGEYDPELLPTRSSLQDDLEEAVREWRRTRQEGDPKDEVKARREIDEAIQRLNALDSRMEMRTDA